MNRALPPHFNLHQKFSKVVKEFFSLFLSLACIDELLNNFIFSFSHVFSPSTKQTCPDLIFINFLRGGIANFLIDKMGLTLKINNLIELELFNFILNSTSSVLN